MTFCNSNLTPSYNFLETPNIVVNCSSSTTLIEGDNFTCECTGTNGNPPADVTWYKNDKMIVTGKENTTLSLSNVDKDENGTYRCEAKSGIEAAKNKTSIDLIVYCEYIKCLYRYSKPYLKGSIEWHIFKWSLEHTPPLYRTK